MSNKLSVHKIALALPRFEALKIGLCTVALVFSASVSAEVSSVDVIGSATLAAADTNGAVNKDLRGAINKDTVATDKSGAYVSSPNSDTATKVSPSAEQTGGSNIKEKAKVYRDPYGNRLKAPPRKQSAEQRAQAEARNVERNENAKLSRPTSSITKVGAAAKLGAGAAAAATAAGASANGDSKAAPAKLVKLKSAVIYFSKPEKSNTTNVDAMSGASTVKVKERIIGITEHEATLIAKYTKADLFRLDRNQPYSSKHSELILESSEEMDAGVNPESKLIPIFDPSGYDVIFVGFPLWWSDMPMPLYSFFEDHDLSGKIVIPFATYGNKSRTKVFTKIAKLEPNAQVTIKRGLKTHRADIAKDGDRIVKEWLGKLDANCFKGLLPPGSEAKLKIEDDTQANTSTQAQPMDKATAATRSSAFAPGRASAIKPAQ